MTEKFDSILEKISANIPTQVSINLPKLKKVNKKETPKIKLPKLKKVTEASVWV